MKWSSIHRNSRYAYRGTNPDFMVSFAQVKERIDSVITHYKGKVAAWDVVNEALNDSNGLGIGRRAPARPAPCIRQCRCVGRIDASAYRRVAWPQRCEYDGALCPPAHRQPRARYGCCRRSCPGSPRGRSECAQQRRLRRRLVHEEWICALISWSRSLRCTPMLSAPPFSGERRSYAPLSRNPSYNPA